MATPHSVRYLNEMRALNALFRRGGMSRSDLARLLGLNRSSVGSIVEDLITDGLARERATLPRQRRGETRTGRPGIVVELAPAGATFLGVEIGVDHIAVTAVDLAVEQIYRQSMQYPTSERSAAISIRQAADLVNAMIVSLGKDRGPIKGLCVTVPALVRNGTVLNGLMLGWHDVQLRTGISELLSDDIDVFVENDAKAFAIGETYRVLHAGSDTIALLLIENGCGGGIVIGGQLVRGSSEFAGEFGQLPLGGEGYCRGRHRPGHLESYVGKDAVMARYHANGAPPSADLQHLLKAVRAQDPVALRTAREWGGWLAAGLLNITNVLNPSRIILGGSVAPLYSSVKNEVQATLEKELIEGFPVPEIKLSSLGPDGAAFGAACLLHQHMFAINEELVHAQAQLGLPSPAVDSSQSRDNAATSYPRVRT